MGWASGSGMMDEIIDAMNEVGLDEVTRKELYEKFIEIFENQDCDTLQECEGKDTAFDDALKTVHPDWGVIDDGWSGDESEDE